MAKVTASTTMIITEVQQSGTGVIEDVREVFRWTSAEHSSAQGVIDLHLLVKTVRKEMPGSNQVVEHGLSATWQPFNISGEWDDKWGNRRGPGLVSTGSFAFTTYREFAAFVTRMPFVRIEIDALSFVGVIQELKIRYERQTKIGWMLTMSPHQNETVSVERPALIVRQSIPAWLNTTKDQVDALNAAFADFSKLPLKTPRVDNFTRIMLEINDAMDRLQRVGTDGLGTQVETRLLLIAQTFRRLRGAGLSATIALRNVTSQLDVAYDDIMLTIKHTEWWTTTLSDAWKMIGVSTEAERDVRSRVRLKPKAIHYPKRGEPLEKISLRYYGTADNWRAIYDGNNLSSLILDGTEELLIPERSS